VSQTATQSSEPSNAGEAPFPALEPLDTHNQTLLGNAHPPDWVNPTPADRYNLVVIGAGTAGLVTAAGAAGLGAKVALVERELMGGDCLNVGCVPSKALLRCSRAVVDVQNASEFGVEAGTEPSVDFPAIMARMRRLRAEISPHDSAARFRDLGIDVFIGEARFTGADTVKVDDQTLRFSKACIATGARAAAPAIEGIEEAGYLTNETVFSLMERPKRLAVLGAGPIGCELAQAFARFGTQVTLLESRRQILGREDRDAAQRVEQSMRRDGVQIDCCAEVKRVRRDGDERVLTLVDQDGTQREARVDHLLVSVGRRPNIEALDLEAAGVEHTKAGVTVDDRLRTTNRRIYGAGDVALPHKFTHVADASARIVIQNALFFGRSKSSALTIPWCTYTDPEIAHVGLSEHEAREKGIELTTHTVELGEVDRAILDGETEGLVKIHLKKGTDKIVGGTVVARHAGDMISELTLAMTSGLGLGAIGKTIHPYPTQAEGLKKAADAHNRGRLTPFVKKVFEKLLAWQR